jgi:hypothetical protein
MTTLKGLIKIANSDGVAFSDTRKNDLIIYTTSNSQRILIGPGPSNNITISSNLVDIGGNLNFTGALTQNGASFQTSRWSSNANGIHILSNVGIGTSTPTSTLDVAGNVKINGDLASGVPTTEGVFIGRFGSGRPAIEMVGATDSIIDFTTINNDTRGRIYYAHASDTMTLRTAAADRLTITGTGNVGINNSSPAYRLDVSGNARISSNLDVGLDGTPGIIRLGGPAGDTPFDHAVIATRLYGNNDVSEMVLFKGNDSSQDRIRLRASELVFDTYSSSTTSYTDSNIRMLISSAGNVGIGTAAPAAPLHVNGEIRATTLTGSLSTANLSGTVAVANGGTGTTTSSGSGSVVLTRGATLSGNIHYAGNVQVGQGTGISTFQLGNGNINEMSQGNRVNTNQNGQITCYVLDQSSIVGNGWFQARGGDSADFTIFMDTTQSDCRINAGNGARSSGRTLRLQTNGSLVDVGGSLTVGGGVYIGNTGLNYEFATTNGPGIQMNCQTFTDIVVHDSGNKYAGFMHYHTSTGFTIGHNSQSWGATNVRFGASIFPDSDAGGSCGISGNRWSALWTANGTIQTSDSSLKNYEALSYGLSDIVKVDTIIYSWKSQENLADDNPEKHWKYYGIKADQVAEIFPELVYNEQTPFQINYAEIIPILINSIKDLKKENDNLSLRISKLESP